MFWVQCGLFAQVPATLSRPGKVAVISTGDTADLANLVTAELSKNPAIIVIDRSDLSKVGD